MITDLANQISSVMIDLLTQAEKAEWSLPFYVVVVGANGGMMTGAFTDNGKGEAEFIQRSKDDVIEIPFNIFLSDERGQALRIVCEEGLAKPSLKDFVN